MIPNKRMSQSSLFKNEEEVEAMFRRPETFQEIHKLTTVKYGRIENKEKDALKGWEKAVTDYLMDNLKTNQETWRNHPASKLFTLMTTYYGPPHIYGVSLKRSSPGRAIAKNRVRDAWSEYLKAGGGVSEGKELLNHFDQIASTALGTTHLETMALGVRHPDQASTYASVRHYAGACLAGLARYARYMKSYAQYMKRLAPK